MTGIFTTMNLSAQNDSIAVASEDIALDLGRNVEYSLKNSTGAISIASSEKLSHKSAINVSNQFYGMLPGLQALQRPGTAWEENAKLFVRGIGSLNKKEPLIIVDGFERSIKELTAEEIESVTILKDAVSTSIYGMRGANGVILVKTKRGTMDKPEIGFSYTFNMATPNRLPEFVNGYEYASALNEALVNDGLPRRYSDNELNAFRDQTHPGFYPNVDWVDEALRNMTFGDDVNFTAKGGGSNVRYYTMLNFKDNRGLLQPTSDNEGYSTQHKYSKLNIRTNLDITFSENTEVKLNFMGVFDESNRPGTSTSDLFNAIYQVPAGAFPIKTDRGVWGGTEKYSNNPIALISGRGYSRSQYRSLYADMHLKQRLDFILSGLSTGFKVGIDNSATYQDNNTKKFGYEEASLDETGNPIYKTLEKEGNLGFSKSVNNAVTHFNFEAYANYNKVWGKHALNTTLTYAMDKTSVKGRNKSRAFIDIMGQANYSYDNKYLVDFTLGSSASSALDPDDRWGIFPSAGLGWIISNEDFMQNADWLNFLKVRASYGVVGMADYDLDIFKDIYGGGNSYFFGANIKSNSGKKLSQLGIVGLTYEKSHKANVGIDFQAFNKLTVGIDAFYDHRTDILVESTGSVSSALGINPSKENAGIVDNKGIEVMAGWNDKINDFSYHIGGNFSFVRNEIKEMNEEQKTEDYLYATGGPLDAIFGYEVEGIYQSQEQIDQREVKQFIGPVKPGDFMYKDQNGDNRIDSYDRVRLGYNSTCPEIYYSFDLGAEYKGVGIYAMFQGAGNYSKILNTRSIYRPITNNNTISEHYYANRWHEGNKNGTFPRLTYTGSDNNYATNSFWVADASFLKLRTLELYYNIPTKAISKIIPMNKFKVFARAHDLFCIDNIDLQDPEAIGAVHPTMTQYSFGFNLIF